jgi:hypothetical protein
MSTLVSKVSEAANRIAILTKYYSLNAYSVAS